MPRRAGNAQTAPLELVEDAVRFGQHAQRDDGERHAVGTGRAGDGVDPLPAQLRADLLAKRLGFNRDTGADATEVVRKAADRADVPAEPVGTIRGEDILDDLFTAPPESHLPCLDAAMTATEQGPGLIAQRGADWRGFDVPAVMANPLEVLALMPVRFTRLELG